VHAQLILMRCGIKSFRIVGRFGRKRMTLLQLSIIVTLSGQGTVSAQRGLSFGETSEVLVARQEIKI
jgi:hypothetical protein